MRWGIDDFRHALRARARRALAAGDGGRRRVARGARRGRREVHDPGAPPGPARAAARRRGVGGRGERRSIRAAPYLWRGPRGLSAGALLLRRPDLARDRVRAACSSAAEHVVAWLEAAFSDARTWPQLVHCATDGETYGHHRRFGEMALAAAVQQIEAADTATLTNYGAFLAAHPPTHEVEIRENTSWSCAHGVERWRSDCGCRTRGDWHQRWRAPLREALDWLRDQIDPFFEARASAHLKDPWAARDDYAAVVLDRSAGAARRVLRRPRPRPRSTPAARVETRRLLELQRHRLLMYTSCGWFFDEISGHRARAESSGTRRWRSSTSTTSAAAGSRTSSSGGSRRRRATWPSCATVPRSTGAWSGRPSSPRAGSWRTTRSPDSCEDRRDGHARLRLPRAAARRGARGVRRHRRYASATSASLRGDGRDRRGGVRDRSTSASHDFSCGVRAWSDPATYDTMKADLLGRCTRQQRRRPRPRARRALPGRPRVARATSSSTSAGGCWPTSSGRRSSTTRRRTGRIWEESRKLVHYLREVDAPIPEALALVARHVLEQQVTAALEPLPELGAIPERVFAVVDEARALGLTLDLVPLRFVVHRAVRARPRRHRRGAVERARRAGRSRSSRARAVSTSATATGRPRTSSSSSGASGPTRATTLRPARDHAGLQSRSGDPP